MSTSPTDLDRIVTCAIHPSIGVARVGNSQSAYFIGPEAPGWTPGPDERFKDEDGRIKRQAARFRIYGLDEQGNVVKELTTDDARIDWRVHLANRKAGWYEFQNAMDLKGKPDENGERPDLAIPVRHRNQKYAGSRDDLVIDPGPRKISGKDVHGVSYHFDTGRFVRKPVYLGELRTDSEGRLLVLGGHGQSASATGEKAVTFANNDGWHDDVSDGPVRATVTLGGRVMEAEPAMVVVTPPNYGPGLYGVVTMYDVVADLFASELGLPENPSFWRHVYPIFERLANSGGSNSGIWMLFGAGSPSDLSNAEVLARLADPSENSRELRQQVFRWFRNPSSNSERLDALPPFYGDAFGDYTDEPQTGLLVTATQYRWLEAWAHGAFDPDPTARETWREIEALPIAEQPHALDRAHLESCLGGPFHPGIELTWTLRHRGMWRKPFRLNVLDEGASVNMDYGETLTSAVALSETGPLSASGPGTLTWWMGVPWQTDEASCMSGYQAGTYLPLPSYWAARVPNQVLPEAGYKRFLDGQLPLVQRVKHLTTRGEWLRFFSTQYQSRINSSVALWDRVGIVAERPGPSDAAEMGLPERLWVETEVWPGFVNADPTFEMVLLAEGASAKREKEMLFYASGAGEDRPLTAHARRTRRRDEL
jgi:hypothetical protein